MAGPGIISRVSISTESVEAGNYSGFPAVSRDGRYVAFESWASNLVPDDNNLIGDIFLRDTHTGTTTRVSTTGAGQEANSFSIDPAISDDGTKVAFVSNAFNLVAGDENGLNDIYVKNLNTGETVLVSQGPAGELSNGNSSEPAISGDGRYVAFENGGDSLLPGADTNGKDDIYVKDLQTGALTIASTSSQDVLGDGYSGSPDISLDGTVVAFQSNAPDLIPVDTNADYDVFVKNTSTGELKRVSVDENGNQVEGNSSAPSLSDSGNYVSFDTVSADLLPGDANGVLDVYVKKVSTDELWRASADAEGNESADQSYNGSISGDGNFVAFMARGQLVPEDTGGSADVYVKHLDSGAIRRASLKFTGEASIGNSGEEMALSADGRFVAFKSYADTLVNDDENSKGDVFIAPAGRTYLFTWYDDVNADNWLLMGNSSRSATERWFHAEIDGEAVDLPEIDGNFPGRVPPGKTGYGFYGVVGGPVRVMSLTGKEALVSQRIVWGDYSLDEYLGVDSQLLSSTYFWTWYDQSTPGYQNWVMVSNPNGRDVFVRIWVGTELVLEDTIAPGASISPSFPGKMGGPLVVRAWTDETRNYSAPVMASQRVLSAGGGAFNEEPGIAVEDLADRYLWTWYDQYTPGFQNWVIIANPNAYDVYYEITINGQLAEIGDALSTETVVTSFDGVMGGPVELRAWKDDTRAEAAAVVASQRAVAGPSFEETPGYPVAYLSWLYEWTWYDDQTSGMENWVLVTNPGSVPVYYEIKVGGVSQDKDWLQPGQIDTPRFDGIMDGPVEVEGFTDDTMTAPAPVFASQRVLWNGYFNEVLGQSRDYLPLP